MAKEAPSGPLANRLKDIYSNFNSEVEALNYFIKESTYNSNSFITNELKTLGATLEQYREVLAIMKEAYENSKENNEDDKIIIEGTTNKIEYTKSSLKRFIVTYTERIQKQDRIINMNMIVSYNQLNSIFDSTISDLIKEIFNKNNSLITQDNQNKKTQEEKSIPYSILLKYENLNNIIEDIIEEKVIKIGYKSIDEQIEFIKKSLNSDVLSEQEITEIKEFRATRNIYVHNKGIVNKIYLQSTGNTSFKNGDLRTIDMAYITRAIELYKIFVESIIKILRAKYIRDWGAQ